MMNLRHVLKKEFGFQHVWNSLAQSSYFKFLPGCLAVEQMGHSVLRTHPTVIGALLSATSQLLMDDMYGKREFEAVRDECPLELPSVSTTCCDQLETVGFHLRVKEIFGTIPVLVASAMDRS